MSTTRRQIEHIVEALDETPAGGDADRETVERLGVDVPALAAQIRGRIAAADAKDQKQRVEDATQAYARELERLERRRTEPARSREAQIGVLKALLAKAPRDAISMHFHKFESASDEEIDELIRSLRHLLGEDDD